MSAVMKTATKTVWQEIQEEAEWERHLRRDPSAEDLAHVDSGDALRYVQEQGEDAAALLADSVAGTVEDDKALLRLNSCLDAVMTRGENMPAVQMVELVELLQRQMTANVRGRIQRRIEREAA